MQSGNDEPGVAPENQSMVEDFTYWAAVRHEKPFDAEVKEIECSKILDFNPKDFKESEQDGSKKLFLMKDEKQSTDDSPSYIVLQVLRVAANKTDLKNDGRLKKHKLNVSDINEVLEKAYDNHLKNTFAESNSNSNFDIKKHVSIKEKEFNKKKKDKKYEASQILLNDEEGNINDVDSLRYELKKKQEVIKTSQNLCFDTDSYTEMEVKDVLHAKCELKFYNLKVENQCLQKQIEVAEKLSNQVCESYENRIQALETNYQRKIEDLVQKMQSLESDDTEMKGKKEILVLKDLIKQKDAAFNKLKSEKDTLVSKMKCMKSELDSLRKINNYHKKQEGNTAAVKRRLFNDVKEADGVNNVILNNDKKSMTADNEAEATDNSGESVAQKNSNSLSDKDFIDNSLSPLSDRCSTPKTKDQKKVESKNNHKKRSFEKSPLYKKELKKSRHGKINDASSTEKEKDKDFEDVSYESDNSIQFENDDLISINFKIDKSLEIYLVHSDGKIDNKEAQKFIDFKRYFFKLSNGKEKQMYHLACKVFIPKEDWDNIKVIRNHSEFIRALLDEFWGSSITKKALKPNRTKERIEGESREPFTPRKWKALEVAHFKFLEKNKYENKRVKLTDLEFKKTDPKRFKNSSLGKAMAAMNIIIKNYINNKIKRSKEQKEDNKDEDYRIEETEADDEHLHE